MLLISSRCVRPSSFIRVACLASDAAAVKQAGVPVHEGPSSSLPTDDRNIQPHIAELVEQIAKLPLLEVADLNYALKKRLNIPDQPVFAAGAFAAAATPAANEPAKEAEEDTTPKKTMFAVKLTKFDETKKIALIKEIRNAIQGLNLVQAKKFVETAPVEVKTDLGKNEADALKALLEKAGATCELKRMARGHQKLQSQQKNAKKQADAKKASGSDQKTAAAKALIYKCAVCMTQMPDM
ncbi:hypothetical protein M3Y97_00269400 [Aphelenchoides bicaudatus]|nr:hypothetical protein M3Y97_00269400 [Aphelenchoides bicaudatus]